MKKFRNDKERIAFLEDYTNTKNGWKLDKEDTGKSRRWWRLDLPDGTVLIVEEELRTFIWPIKHTEWNVLTWFIIKDWDDGRCFGDRRGSRTQALAILKEVEKSDKRRGSQDPAKDPGTGSMGAAD